MAEKLVRVLHRRAPGGAFSSNEGNPIVLIERPVRHARRLKPKRPESIAETRRAVIRERKGNQ